MSEEVKYIATLPSGQTREVWGKPGAPQELINRFALDREVNRIREQERNRIGFWRALEQSFLESTVDAPEAIGLTRDPTEERERRMLDYAQAQRGMGWEDVKDTFRERGVRSGLADTWEFGKQLAGGTLGAMAPGIAGGKIGGTIGAAAGPKAAGIGALAGFVGGMTPGEYRRMLTRQIVEREAQRQREEELRDLEFGQAAAGAVGASALNYLALMPAGITRLLQPRSVDPRVASVERAQRLVDESIPTRIAKGTGLSALGEVPTEIGQSAISRAQAGLPISFRDPEALAEYEEAAVGALLLSPLFGGVGRQGGAMRARQYLEEVESQKQAQEAEQRRIESAARTEQLRGAITTAGEQEAQMIAQRAADPALNPIQRLSALEQEIAQFNKESREAANAADFQRVQEIDAKLRVAQEAEATAVADAVAYATDETVPLETRVERGKELKKSLPKSERKSFVKQLQEMETELSNQKKVDQQLAELEQAIARLTTASSTKAVDNKIEALQNAELTPEQRERLNNLAARVADPQPESAPLVDDAETTITTVDPALADDAEIAATTVDDTAGPTLADDAETTTTTVDDVSTPAPVDSSAKAARARYETSKEPDGDKFYLTAVNALFNKPVKAGRVPPATTPNGDPRNTGFGGISLNNIFRPLNQQQLQQAVDDAYVLAEPKDKQRVAKNAEYLKTEKGFSDLVVPGTTVADTAVTPPVAPPPTTPPVDDAAVTPPQEIDSLSPEQLDAVPIKWRKQVFEDSSGESFTDVNDRSINVEPRESKIVQLGDTATITKVNVNGVNVPFYLRGDRPGEGKWYPFFGVSNDGLFTWLREAPPAEVLRYYDSSALRSAAENLDATIGDVRGKDFIERAYDLDSELFSQINEGMGTETATRLSPEELRAEINRVKAAVAEGAPPTADAPAVPAPTAPRAPAPPRKYVRGAPAPADETPAARDTRIFTNLLNAEKAALGIDAKASTKTQEQITQDLKAAADEIAALYPESAAYLQEQVRLEALREVHNESANLQATSDGAKTDDGWTVQRLEDRADRFAVFRDGIRQGESTFDSVASAVPHLLERRGWEIEQLHPERVTRGGWPMLRGEPGVSDTHNKLLTGIAHRLDKGSITVEAARDGLIQAIPELKKYKADLDASPTPVSAARTILAQKRADAFTAREIPIAEQVLWGKSGESYTTKEKIELENQFNDKIAALQKEVKNKTKTKEAALNELADEFPRLRELHVLPALLESAAPFSLLRQTSITPRAEDQPRATPAVVHAALNQYFDSPEARSSVATVVQRVEDLPPDVRAAVQASETDAQQAQAIFHNGRVFMIADRIHPDHSLGVFVHETGVHAGAEAMLGTERVNRLIDQVREWSTLNDGSLESRIANAAMARVAAAETTGAQSRDEALAYFTEIAINEHKLRPHSAGRSKVGQWLSDLMQGLIDFFRGRGFHMERASAQNVVDTMFGAAQFAINRGAAPPITGPSARFSFSAAQAAPPAASNLTNSVVQSMPASLQSPVRRAAEYLTGRDLWQKVDNEFTFTNYIIDKIREHSPATATAANNALELSRRRMVLQQDLEQPLHTVIDLSNRMSNQDTDRAWRLIRDANGKAWPFAPSVNPERFNPNAPIVQEFEGLTAPQQELVRAVFEHNDAIRVRQIQAMDGIVKGMHKEIDDSAGTTKSKTARKKQVSGMLDAIKDLGDTPYTSTRAIGQYIVVGKSDAFVDAQNAVQDATMSRSARRNAQRVLEAMRSDPNHFRVFSADSQKEAERMVASKRAEYGPGENNVQMHPLQGSLDPSVLPFEAIAQLRQAIQRNDKKDPMGQSNTALLQLTETLYIKSMAESSARKKELKRKFSTELNPRQMYQSFLRQASADAHYLSVLETHKDMSESINTMMQTAQKTGNLTVERGAAEINDRFLRSYQYEETPLISGLMNVSAVWMLLTKPAYYFYNMTQPTMMGQPWLAQRFGGGKAYSALSSAYKTVFAAKSINPNKPFNFDGITNKLGEQDMLKQLRNDGLFDNTMMFDTRRIINMDGGRASKTAESVMTFLRNSASRVEQYNRGVMAISAYRLALEKNNGDRAAAYQAAKEAVVYTQGDYNLFNRPSLIGKTAFRRMIAQFRTFQFIQAGLLLRMLRESGLSTPEKRAALQGLTFLLGHHTIMAGAVGLPAFSAVAFALAALGDLTEQDEPKDLEVMLRRTLGTGPMADVLLYGVPAGLFNVNLSQNLGMGTTFSVVPFSDVSFDRAGYQEALIGLLGPTAGLGAQSISALENARTGDYYKMIEGLLPGSLKFGMRAYREGTDGIDNRRGDQLVSAEEITTWDGIAKAMGFTTHTDYVRRMARSKTVEFEAYFNARTTSMKTQYAKAWRDGDSRKMAELRDQWFELQEFKRKYGFNPQPIKNLLAAPKEQREREARVIQGVPTTTSREGMVRQLTGT